MRKTLLLALFVSASLSGCIHSRPDYPPGTLLRSKVSGQQGQVVNWWCRLGPPCQYQVRFWHPEGYYFDKVLQNYEVEPVTPPTPVAVGPDDCLEMR